MRPIPLLAFAALTTVGAACVSKTPSVQNADGTIATADGARNLPASATASPLTPAELSVFRRQTQASTTPVVNPAGLSAPARWDAYLAGDTTALIPAERRGVVTFARAGCSTCHDGISLGGQLYRKLGDKIPVEGLADSGLYNLTKDPSDLFVFKVPSLRNVQTKAGYLRDESIKGLGQTVRLMGRHQVGIDLTEDQVSDIRAYLLSLTGRLPYATDDKGSPAKNR